MSFKFMHNFRDNDNMEIIDKAGLFTVVEQQVDLSVFPDTAMKKFYMAQMDVKRRQLMCTLKDSSVLLSPGAMQLMIGAVEQTTGVRSVGDFAKKALQSKQTGDAAIKPEYKGTGIVMCEPTYRHYMIINVAEWGTVVCDDGTFVACEGTVKQSVVRRTNLSSALAGREGLFNAAYSGHGYVVLSCGVPRGELFEVELNDDVIKIDGNFAVCWSDSLQFTVEKSGKTFIGSAASGEGLVNVYRGTGKILMYPYWQYK